jgi:hypothetical protein
MKVEGIYLRKRKGTSEWGDKRRYEGVNKIKEH